MKKKLNNSNGVTLIALVITIVILLILAGVTITQVVGDGGLLNRSTRFAENVDTSMDQTSKDLNNELNNLDEIMNPWIQRRTTVEKKIKNESKSFVIGDKYEDYKVDGYDGEWMVLGAENGKLLIMSTIDVGELELSGTAGYYKGIEKIEQICARFGENARGIKVEDINRVTGYDPLNQGDGSKWSQGNFDEYGNRVTYKETGCTATNGKNYTGQLDGNKYIHADGRKIGNDDVTEVTVKQTGYSYYPDTLTNNTSGGTAGIATNSSAYSMLFGGTSANSYWLSSSYSSTDYSHSNWGLFTVENRKVDTEELYCSNGISQTLKHGVRVVIAIQ